MNESRKESYLLSCIYCLEKLNTLNKFQVFMFLFCPSLSGELFARFFIPCLLGVYELRMYEIVLGKTEQWVHRLVQGLPDRCKLSEPVGVWFTEFGPVNTGKFFDIAQDIIQINRYGYERFKFLHKFIFELF